MLLHLWASNQIFGATLGELVTDSDILLYIAHFHANFLSFF